MLLILYIPTPLLRRYTDGQCVMDFSFPWIQTKVFLGYIVYSWVVFSYFVPVLVTLVSHAWIIHVLKISSPSHQNCTTQNFEATLQIQKKITQLVITTTIMSCQLAILHSFECISQILIACEVVVYTYGTPIEQMGTILILLGSRYQHFVLIITVVLFSRSCRLCCCQLRLFLDIMTSNLGFFDLMDNFLPSDKCLLVNDLGCTSYSTSVSCPNSSCLCVTEDLQLMEQHYATCHHHSCSLCGLSFISSRLLSIHEQITHCGAFKPKLDCFLVACPQRFCDSAKLFAHAYDCHGLLPDSSVLIGTMISVKNRNSNKIMSEFVVHRWDESVDGQLTLENMLKKLKSELPNLFVH
ncbi:unnamed protein product [Schistosoma haematobium]|nr:unnamed protein product [Schistosoma haematobium]